MTNLSVSDDVLRSGAGLIELRSGLSMPALIGRLRGGGDGEDGEDGGRGGMVGSVDGLLHALAANRHFRRDTSLGALFHRRTISFREISPTDSLHVVFHRDHVSAHLDRISPLNVDPESPAHYSWPRVVAHNLSVIAEWLVQLVRGASR